VNHSRSDWTLLLHLYCNALWQFNENSLHFFHTFPYHYVLSFSVSYFFQTPFLIHPKFIPVTVCGGL
jgi:hypothetical protein